MTPDNNNNNNNNKPPRWPNGARAALSFTMDNLGEAQAVRTKTHPREQPIGTDPSVHTTLPRILDLLDSSGGIKATYFAESWSLPVYPAAAAELRRRGHELAWHGYQHETWRALSTEDAERAVFARSWDVLLLASGAGHVTSGGYEGFRPPGGETNGARTLALCREYGVRYVSPLGHHVGIDADTGVVVLPFEWETVDAFWYMDTPKFVEIRRRLHGREQEDEVPGPEAFRRHLLARLEALKQDGGYVAILFHPFLQTSDERFAVLEEVLDKISSDEDIWVAPCNEVASWVTEHAEAFGSGTGSGT